MSKKTKTTISPEIARVELEFAPTLAFSTNVTDLIQGLKSSALFTSKDSYRQVLTTPRVYIERGERTEDSFLPTEEGRDVALRLISTDTHRLTTLEIEGEAYEPCNFSLPNEILPWLISLKCKSRAYVEFIPDPISVYVNVDGKSRIFPIEDKGAYPNWQRVVSPSWKSYEDQSPLCRLRFKASDLLAIVSPACVKNKGAGVQIAVWKGDSSARIITHFQEIAEVSTGSRFVEGRYARNDIAALACDVSGWYSSADLVLGFLNVKYLQDALKVFGDSEVSLDLCGRNQHTNDSEGLCNRLEAQGAPAALGNRPYVMYAVDDVHHMNLAVIMPMADFTGNSQRGAN